MDNYAEVIKHHPMLFDKVRNDIYWRVINSLDLEGKVILDIGSGLGILGLMSATKTIKHIYLVDSSPILDITSKVVRKNNLQDRVTCIKDRIENVLLPEKVDIIISVFTGNFLLTEDLLPSLFFARDKYLLPNGKLIPDCAKMMIVPVSAKDYYNKYIDCWSVPLYGIDYSAVRKYAVNTIYSDRLTKNKVKFLSEPVEILELDFMKATEAACRIKEKIEIKVNCELHGFAGWFQAKVGNEWMSTSPKDKQMHWNQVFLPLDKPLNVREGDIVIFQLIRPEFGDWTWTVKCNDTTQTMSTFFSEPLSKSNIRVVEEN